MSALIQVEFDVFEVTWDSSDRLNFDLDAMFKNSNAQIAYGGARTAVESAAGGFGDDESIENEDLSLSRDRGSGSFVFLKPDSRFSGSGAVFDTLSKSSNEVKVESRTFVIPNNRWMDVEVADISQVVVGRKERHRHHQGATVNSETERIRSFDTGTALRLQAMVASDGLIVLGYNLTLEELVYPAVGGTVIENAAIRSRRRKHTVSGEVRVPSGVRLVFNHATNTSATSSLDGIGKPSFFLLGGGRESDSQRTTMLITLRPSAIHTGDMAPHPAREGHIRPLPSVPTCSRCARWRCRLRLGH